LNSKIQAAVLSLLPWYAKNARDLPWRNIRDPYGIWVSEIMLQQTQVKTVVPYWTRWMKQLPTIAALAKARPERIHKLWEGLGYYTRVRNMQKAAQAIGELHGGRFPERFDDILALPGIGRYTAGAISSIAFNQPVPILDGNVMRVLARVFGVDGDPRAREVNARLWQLATELVTEAARRPDPEHAACSRLNQSLMELGALICTPKQPRCGECPVASYCVAYRENRVETLPAPARRVKVTARRFVAFIAQRGSRFLVRQRPAGVVNAHLWEFPNVEVISGKPMPGDAPFHTVRHSITHYRITLEAYRVDATRAGKGGVWLEKRRLARLPFTSAHRKILLRLIQEN
jgi:A/G-specific adenine glycosylase